MQARIERLETKVSELTYEIRSLINTQKEIASTLKEFKDISLNLALLRQDLNNVKDTVNILFKKDRDVENRLLELEKTDSAQGVKISNAERGFWVVITAVVASAVAYFRGA